MKRFAVVVSAALLLFAAEGYAAYEDLIKKACGQGLPWRLPKPTGGLSTVEAPIKLDGTAGQMLTVCNCTADAAGKTAAVWVRSSASSGIGTMRSAGKPKAAPKPDGGKAAASKGGEGGTVAHLLPPGSCIWAGSPTIVLAPVDTDFESWGTFGPTDAALK